MAILNKEEFNNALKAKFGESTEETDIELLENLTDTYADMEKRISSGNGDWEKKYNDLHKRYVDRFFNKGKDDDDDTDPEPEDKPKGYRFEDLFTTK